MKIYLEKAIIVNRAPFDKIDLDFNENDITVLTAINGKGKTTIISHIVDAFYEMARPHYTNEFEDRENKFYRISTNIHLIDMNLPSIVYLRFKTDKGHIDYIDVRNELTSPVYDSLVYLQNKIPFNNLTNSLKDAGFARVLSNTINKKDVNSLFDNNILSYFPSYRFEQPGYLNDPYKIKLDFRKNHSFSGYMINPIEVITILPELSNWIMDIILDQQYKDSDVNLIKDNINKIITETLSSKKLGNLRLGVGPRGFGGTRIQIVNKETGKSVAPSIFNLSSGELSVLCIFGELLRQADNYKNNIKLEDITGIILIDEVDKHLHITLQKEVLPNLFNLFPNVQFILSSHSPFLHMGLIEECNDRTKLFDLDNFGVTKELHNNALFKEVYEMMVNKNNNFKEMYDDLKKRIVESTLPLIITEGKTDIIHIKKAMSELNISNLDLDFIEPQCQPEGDSNLKALLEKISKIQKNRIVIGIFDRDQPSIIKDIERDGQLFKNYGNKVYAFCIKSPEYRVASQQTLISIEYLYSNTEITTMLSNNTRLFIGTEFTKKSMKHNTEELFLSVPKGKGKDVIIENNGGQAVFDNDDNNVLAKKVDFSNAIENNQLKISDESWENFRHIFDMIDLIKSEVLPTAQS